MSQAALTCRLCGSGLTRTFVDLGMSPPCESFLDQDQLDEPEMTYPLHVRTCSECLLVQLPAHVPAVEIFSHYAYFSSYSDSWVDHAGRFVGQMVDRLGLDTTSLVIEVASNDGYLLQHAVARGIPVLGVEPAANVAETAVARGVPTVVEFLNGESGRRIAGEHGRADLVVANNVLAHVPDVVDFVRGLSELVKPTGMLTLEFPHLQRLIEQRQYDTIYHEHYSYFTLLTASKVLATAGFSVVDVEQLTTHGGSLRVFAQLEDAGSSPSAAVEKVLAEERAARLDCLAGHDGFADAVTDVKRELLAFLITASREGRQVVGYGAPGKGNTLLNHCGVRADLLTFTVDKNPFKHGKFLPGTHIPVLPVDALSDARPDFVLVLPWNLRDEIVVQLAAVKDWGGRLVLPIPKLEIL